MPSCPEDIIALFPTLDSDTLVLTPNHLTSTQVLDWYGQYRRENKLSAVYASPAMYPVDIWIQQLGTDLLNSGSPLLPASDLLGSAQEKLLWHAVISQTESGKQLLNVSSTAKAVQEAWTLVHLWHISAAELRSWSAGPGSGHDDLAAYLEWSNAFSKFCQQKNVFTQVELLTLLIPLIAEKQVQLPGSIVLLGFANSPPLYKRLLDTLDKTCNTHSVAFHARQPTHRVQACEDATAELQAAAGWARQVLEQDPDARIGIIMPDLHKRHAQVQRVFSRCFVSQESRALAFTGQYPFTLSSARPLGNVPLVRTALLCLARNRQTTETLDACLFLRSAFLAGTQKEAVSRARLECFLRDRNTPLVSNSDLKTLARIADRPFHCPDLAKRLDDFDAVPRPGTGKSRYTREWADIFMAQLAALGWPGDRQPDETENLARQSWLRVLETYSRLGSVFGKLSLNEALNLLTRLSSNDTFRPGDFASSVRILTPVEADGLYFSHCRMLGLSEQQWPPAPRVSPFIPFALQKQKGVPETDSNKYSNLMHQVLQNLAAHTEQEMLFSYPLMSDDIPLKPTAMLRNLVTNGWDDKPVNASALHPLAEPLLEDYVMEILEDSAILPLHQTTEIKGGSSLIADQAECPFRSFAIHRLKARPLENLVYGLSPRAAGNLVHLALELLWQRLLSQVDLLAMNNADLEALVKTVVSDAINSVRNQHFRTMTDSFCALEEIRLMELLLQWLAEERKRGSFTVLASELKTSWECNGIKLTLRIDRIDRSNTGELVLVDYKTGRRTGVDWEDERPVNSQLMLYHLAVTQERLRANQAGLDQDDNVTGVYFAQVNIEKTQYIGLSALPGTYPGSSVEELRGKWRGLSEQARWQDLLAGWEQSLSALVGEFLNGCVAITPKAANCCDNCFVRPVCRIDEVIES